MSNQQKILRPTEMKTYFAFSGTSANLCSV